MQLWVGIDQNLDSEYERKNLYLAQIMFSLEFFPTSFKKSV